MGTKKDFLLLKDILLIPIKKFENRLNGFLNVTTFQTLDSYRSRSYPERYYTSLRRRKEVFQKFKPILHQIQKAAVDRLIQFK